MDLDKLDFQALKGYRGEAKAMMAKALVAYGEAMGATTLAEVSDFPANIVFGLEKERKDVISRLDLLINSGQVSKNGFRLGLEPMDDLVSLSERLTKLGALPETERGFFPEETNLAGQYLPFSFGAGAVYASSILGAYIEPLPSLIAIFASVYGKVPVYGHMLKENRQADCRMTLTFQGLPEPAVLGTAIANKAKGKVPYVIGLGRWLPNYRDDRAKSYLKALCQALYVNGMDLVHIEEYGQEAKTKGQRLLKPDWEEMTLGQSDLLNASDSLPEYQKTKKKVVILGAPEMSLSDMYRYAAMLRGDGALSKKGKLPLKLYFNTAPKAAEEFLDSPEGKAFLKMGGNVISYDLSRGLPISVRDPKKIATDDPALSKQGYAYLGTEKGLRYVLKGGRL